MKRTYWNLLAVGAIAALTAACGNTGGNEVKDTEQKPEPGEPVELVFFSNNGASETVFDNNYGNALRKAFPQYTIKYIQKTTGTSLPELVASGTRIDIYWDSIGNYESRLFENGLQYDIDVVDQQTRH